MGMPNHLVLIRHGESEGNVAVKAGEAGDYRHYTDEYMITPGHQWRLTNKGQTQAEIIGKWVREEITERFDRYYVSPYVRTRETAGHLQLPGAEWQLNRALRERDWGDIGPLPWKEFKENPIYQHNLATRNNDPLYWVAPGGESIAQVSEDRVRNFLSTLHRENSGQKVVAVTHGEAISAFRLSLERLSDEEFVRIDRDKSESVRNCEAFHYTRVNPFDGTQAPRLTWLRRSSPALVDGQWVVQVGPWVEFHTKRYTNQELLDGVSGVSHLIHDYESK